MLTTQSREPGLWVGFPKTGPDCLDLPLVFLEGKVGFIFTDLLEPYLVTGLRLGQLWDINTDYSSDFGIAAGG